MKQMFLQAKELLTGIPKVDFHIHTTYSDGTNKIEEYVLKALEEKYLAICFTDHVDFTTNWFKDYKNEILEARKKYKSLSVYCGLEVRAKDYKGNLNTSKEILDESDVVIGVVHSIPSEDGKNKYHLKNFPIKKALELEYKAIMGLLKNSLIDVLGHPMSNYEKYFGEVPEEYYVRILEMAKKEHVAIELNPVYQRNFHKFLKLNLNINPLISLGSNAHSVLELGMSIKKIKELI